MHIHILGICGTFMAGLALLAKKQGHRITGCDSQVYPPMSTQLQEQGIELIEGYDVKQLEPKPDLVVIGNAMSRGNPCVEAILERRIPFTSGPQFLSEHILRDRHVLAISGTHGKTTTSSMLAWILEASGHDVGFLIGGVPQNFGVSARLGTSKYFVIEADEYDSAFFDKRSKFIHYQPNTLVINNLEFDHADIFSSLEDIQRQFHHLIRTVPGSGLICYPTEASIKEVISQGCWSRTLCANSQSWHMHIADAAGHVLELKEGDQIRGHLSWPLMGQHNADNALMACLAAQDVGVKLQDACNALSQFKPPKRRLELLYHANDIQVYDDFAHHPTAITTTLTSLKKNHSEGRIIAVFEPRSATMKRGVHQETLAHALAIADVTYIYQAQELAWDVSKTMQSASFLHFIFEDVQGLLQQLLQDIRPYDIVLIMSNGSFEGLHQDLVKGLQQK